MKPKGEAIDRLNTLFPLSSERLSLSLSLARARSLSPGQSFLRVYYCHPSWMALELPLLQRWLSASSICSVSISLSLCVCVCVCVCVYWAASV